jgi:hypothetical protein
MIKFNILSAIRELERDKQEEREEDERRSELDCEHADREFDERRLNGK